jgi:hypothetical protein
MVGAAVEPRVVMVILVSPVPLQLGQISSGLPAKNLWALIVASLWARKAVKGILKGTERKEGKRKKAVSANGVTTNGVATKGQPYLSQVSIFSDQQEHKDTYRYICICMETTQNTDIFLITSVLNTGSNPWTYTTTRSVFSTQDRFQQTLETIASIRVKCPAAKILLCDCSDLSPEMTTKCVEEADLFFQTFEHTEIRDACIQSNKKGYGELLKTQYIVKYLETNNIPFRRLIKISGRYFLNKSFQLDAFSDITYTFRQPFPNSTCNPTVLYSIPFHLLIQFKEAIEQSKHEFTTNTYGMYEVSLPSKCEPKHSIPTCGVSGYVAVDGSLYEDL